MKVKRSGKHLNWYENGKKPPVPYAQCAKCIYGSRWANHIPECNYVTLTDQIKKMPSVEVRPDGRHICKYFCTGKKPKTVFGKAKKMASSESGVSE